MKIFALILLAFWIPWLSHAKTEKAPPNILFISIDDLNDWIEPLGGHPLVKTPHMSRLAKEGVTFSNAHCQSPICNPSRTSLMTGLRPSTTGVYALGPWFRTLPQYTDWVTLPQHFMQQGYHVVATGKNYHDAYPPLEDRVDGSEFSVWGLKGDFVPRPKKRIATPHSNIPLVDWGVFPEKSEDCFDYDITTYAVDQLRNAPKDKPLFLCVGIRHPHFPCYAPQSFFDLYPDDDSVLPPVIENDREDVPEFAWNLNWRLPEPRLSWLKEHHEWRPLVRAYLASVSFADAMVGRLLDALEESGLKENTIVVLWSDHGWHNGEKMLSGKNTLWERSARVPLIIAGPGFAKDAVCKRPVELLDLYPTLVEACALPERQGLDGRSLLALLKNPQAEREQPAITTHGPNNHAVRSEKWRYIRYANGDEELYDMENDPNEWTNLAGKTEHAAILAQHRTWLPKENAAPAPGSKTRLVEQVDGVWHWEGKPIRGPVPKG